MGGLALGNWMTHIYVNIGTVAQTCGNVAITNALIMSTCVMGGIPVGTRQMSFQNSAGIGIALQGAGNARRTESVLTGIK